MPQIKHITMSYSFKINSYEQYKADYQKSVHDPEGFWGEVAASFYWRKKWDKVLNWNFAEPKVE
jgi:acetyl-CoA synthetase